MRYFQGKASSMPETLYKAHGMAIVFKMFNILSKKGCGIYGTSRNK